MKMTRFEKRFVNRRKKCEGQIVRIRQRLERLDVGAIHDVLELGCGVGFVSAFLADEYEMKVLGTDVDPEQIEIAREMQPESEHLRFSVESAVHLTCRNASFDLVLSQFVFHHIAEWEAAVREVARVLRPGGYFMWLDFAYSRFLKGVFRPFVKHYGLYTIDEVRAVFAASGLTSLFYDPVPHGLFKSYDMLLQKG